MKIQNESPEVVSHPQSVFLLSPEDEPILAFVKEHLKEMRSGLTYMQIAGGDGATVVAHLRVVEGQTSCIGPLGTIDQKLSPKVGSSESTPPVSLLLPREYLDCIGREVSEKNPELFADILSLQCPFCKRQGDRRDFFPEEPRRS